MKTFTRSYAFCLGAILMSSSLLNAQDWREPLADPNFSFYDVQADFYQDWGAKEAQLEQSRLAAANAADKFATNRNALVPAPNMQGGYKQFKRWEYFMEPRVYPSGDMTLVSTTNERFMEYLDTNTDAMWQFQRSQPGGTNRVGPPGNQLLSSTWTFAGPTGAPTGGGAGRINFVRFDPTNSNTLWGGAPAGGLWKSINGGASWTTNTDFLTSIGATDVAIDPLNTQNMYLATGDGDAGDTYSIGVLKSTDGGVTWNTTGLVWTVNQQRVISKLLINPTNPLIVIAFTSNGIYRTTNGGTAWTQVQNTVSFKDAEYKPGDPNTVYATGDTFWKSTDGGVTWVQITAGLPVNTAVDRFAIAVTQDPTGTAYVYVLAGNQTNSGFYGCYRSIDSGTTFTTRATTPNLLGWSSTGADTGGQSWYDLAIAASPTNKDVVIVGGVNIWRSTNGGTNWTINGHWTGTGAPYVHADVHDLIFVPGSGTNYYAGCDGGVFYTANSGGAWADLSSNLCIAQPYRIGLSASNATLWLTGHQDNGTNLKNGASYNRTMGGDGMDCFIDRTNNNVMYGSQYSGSLNRSTNGGGNWTAITTGLTGTAPWVTSWYQDPTTANTIYCGRTNLFRSTNQGTNWAAVASAVPGTNTIVDFKIAPSNNQIIYVVKSNAVYKTINAGGAWTTITGTLPVGSAAISRVDVHPTNTNYAVVTFSGYSTGNKVFETTNGGTSWTNISTGLPNLPTNCVRFMPGTANNAMYVGCDVGVYYRDNTFTSWQPYFTALPNSPVFDLEVYQPTGKLRAATYGRGVWEVDIYNPGTLAPIADFTANQTLICPGVPVNFTDMSSFTPTSWSWAFQGGTPATSTAQNPTGITWIAPGTYSVTLTATNTNGSDAETKVAYITVMANAIAPPLVEGFVSTTFLPTGWTPLNINNDGVFWTRSATVGVAPTAGNSAMFDNYNIDVAGARDEMWAPRLNLSSAATATMTFDVAYARYSAPPYSDTLEIAVSTDCGSTWTSVYLKGGTVLATAPDQTASIFVPSAAQWRNESVSLNAFVGQGSVIVSVRNRGRYGQALYVDNINITSTTSALPPVATFTTSATTVCVGTPVNFTDASTNGPTSWTWTFPSGTPPSATTQNVTGVVWNTAGTYTVTHTATNLSGTGTTTQVITVNALPTVTATASNATICNGSSTTLTGAGASTYAWMPGSLSGTTVSVSPTTTTTYTVTGTGANGCISTGNVTVTVNTLPTITTSATSTTICSGNSTTITASGGSTYAWMPGSLTGTSVTVSPTTTTTYTVTGTAANGCTSTSTRLITVNPTPTVTATAAAPTICAGSSTTLTGSGASTYGWMPGTLSGTSVTVTPATTTTYTMTGTAVNGCTAVQTVLVTVTPAPVVTTTATSTTICSGSSTTITASGATTYAWMPGSLTGTSVTVSPATTTTYTVTGTTAGCTGTSTRLITVNPSPTVTATAASPTICVGSSTTLTGSGASTYAWMPGSLAGTTVSVTPPVTTTYTVTGTSVNGCTAVQTVVVTVSPPPTVTVSATPSTICAGSSTTLTAAGAITYAWMPGSLTGTSVTVTPATTTTYTVTGTISGCTGTATQLITVNPAPTVTTSATPSTICSGSSTTITASGATTYAWMPGSLTGTSVTVSPATTTTYTVTGTSAGCTGTSTSLITVNPTPTVTATAASPTICVGNSTTLTGSGASTYSWMPGSLTGTTVTVTPAVTTTYTVTGTAANGCANVQTVVVTVSPPPTVTVSATPSTICAGSSTTLTASGATTYAWMPGSLTGTSVTVTPATTTTYTVTGTISGCTGTATQLITVTPAPTVTTTASPTTICSGSSTTITASGATTYAWMPGSLTGTSVTVSPATTTTYTVTGTTAGCSGTSTSLITVNASPTVAVTAGTTSICTGGTTTLTGSGASTYLWMPGSLTGTTVSVSPAVTTTYTVTGTAANGCTNVQTITITVGAQPSVTTSATSTSICIGSSTTLTGNGATTYLWMPGSLTGTSVTVTPAATTTYTVTGSNGPGCSNTSTITVTVNALPAITTTASSTTVCAGSPTTLTAFGGVTYLWMPGSLTGTSVIVSPLVNTTYTVTGTNAAGCTSTATRAITVNALPTLTVTPTAPSICQGGSVTLVASTTANHTYSWSPAIGLSSTTTATTIASPTVTTTYVITKTRTSTGCSRTATVVVTVNPAPSVTATANNSTICTGNSVTLTGGGATTYAWMPGSLTGTTVTVTPATTTTYTVTGTAATGCTSTQTVTVVVGAQPTVTASSSSSTMCVGNSVTLTGSGTSTYTWMPGSLTGTSVTVSPATSTTYTVTGTSGPGCSNTATVSVVVNALPNVTSSSSSPAVCIGDIVTLTSGGASTYTWMPGSLNGSPVTDAPATSTTYTVTGTDANGCSNTSTVNVNVNAPPTVSASASATTTCIGDSVTLTGTGAVTYNWMPGSLIGSPVNDAPTTSTTYTVTGTDANGCSNTSTVNVNVNALPTIAASASATTTCIGDSVTLTGSGAVTYNWMPGSLIGSPVNDAPATSTTYTVTGTDANGCSNTSTVNVNVNALPTVAASASAANTCSGDTVTLSASGASTYTWMPGSLIGSPVTDAPATSTTYTVTGVDSNGCSNTTTLNLAVNAPPAVTLVLALDTMCDIDGPTLLMGGSPAGGNYTGPGVTANSFDASSVGAGTYTIVYTYVDTNGCDGTASQSMVVDVCSGLPTFTDASELSVVPNPSNGDFVLSFYVASADDYVVEVHNALGQILYTEQLNSFSGQYRNEINLSQYERGLYTIRLRSSHNESTIRIITQ